MNKRMKNRLASMAQRIERYFDDPHADLDGQLAVAREWIALANGDAEEFEHLMDHLTVVAPDWLFQVPDALVTLGRPDDAREFARTVGPLFMGEVFAADLAVALAESGHAEDARRQIAECHDRYPDDAWVHLKCGDALRALGSGEEAEREFRLGLSLAGADDFTVKGALERLVPALESAGRYEEARRLLAERG